MNETVGSSDSAESTPDMGKLTFDRVDIIDAFVTYAVHHNDEDLRDRLADGEAIRLSNVGFHKYDSEWGAINNFSDTAREHYFALVARKKSQTVADELRANWDRIHDPAGVTIQLANSDDDPFSIMFEIHDEIADAWADANGSVCGGTWGCPDKDTSFVYDIGSWYEGIFEELEKEGYKFDHSNYSEPEAEDMVIAKHLADCGVCAGKDFAAAKKHMGALKSVVINGETGE